MPKEIEKKFNKAHDISESTQIQSIEPTDTTAAKTEYTSKKPLLILVIVIFYIGLFFAIGAMIIHARSNRVLTRGSMMNFSRQERPRMMNRVLVQRSNPLEKSNSTILSGVVTSVDGSSFILAGNGSQISVSTTSDTKYNITDKKISVNDSIIVIGVKTNYTISATNIRIVNN